MMAAARTFADRFSGQLSLPLWNVWLRRNGCIRRKGWLVEFRFGTLDGREFVEYRAQNKFSSPTLSRIYDDGTIEEIEAGDDSSPDLAGKHSFSTDEDPKATVNGSTASPDLAALLALLGALCWIASRVTGITWIGNVSVLLTAPLVVRWIEYYVFLAFGFNLFFFLPFEKPLARVGLIGMLWPTRRSIST